MRDSFSLDVRGGAAAAWDLPAAKMRAEPITDSSSIDSFDVPAMLWRRVAA